MTEKVTYLGFEIGATGLRPSDYKVKALIDFPTPSRVHEVRQFVGLVSYFRRFVKNLATLAQPLTKLLKKDAPWEWTTEQDTAFSVLKLRLQERPVLALYNHEAPTEVHTDASKKGLGGMLLQLQSDGHFHPVIYVSRQTSEAEGRYHSYELEALAVVWTLERLRTYLLGIDFNVVTDCSALRGTMSKRELIPRVARWWLRLQEFTFTVIHRDSASMQHVDALSRSPTGPAEEMEACEGLHIYATAMEETDDWLVAAQLLDADVKHIREVLEKPASSAEERRIHSEYKLQRNVVFRNIDGDSSRLLWLVPKPLRWQVVRRSHDDLGHVGTEKTIKRIQEKYWFAGMKRYVRRYVASCAECLYNKTPTGKKPGMLHSIDKVGVPFHTLHLDHLGPFPRSRHGNTYLIVAVDGFTKFVILTPVKNAGGQATTRCLRHIVGLFGPPTRVITDRGVAYTSTTFKKYCENSGIIHILTSTATPRANGQVERFNRTITPAIATLTKDKGEKIWDEVADLVQWSLNNTYHKAIDSTPFRLLFNFESRSLNGDHLDDALRDLSTKTSEEMSNRRKAAIQAIRLDQERQKRRYNQKRRHAPTFEPGDIVVVQREPTSIGESRKLQEKYKGPYVVTKRLPNDTYRIEDIPGHQRTQRYYTSTAPVDKLKRLNTFDVDSEESSEETSSEGT